MAERHHSDPIFELCERIRALHNAAAALDQEGPLSREGQFDGAALDKAYDIITTHAHALTARVIGLPAKKQAHVMAKIEALLTDGYEERPIPAQVLAELRWLQPGVDPNVWDERAYANNTVGLAR